MKRWFAPLVVGMVVIYAALALSAAGCLFLQREETGHVHHSASHAGHSVLCAWACQVNPTVSLQAAVPILACFIVVTRQRSASAVPQSLLITTVSRSRAPPQ